MDEEIRIEPATTEDVPQLAELLVDLFSTESDFRPDLTRQLRGLRLILEQPNRGRIFVLRGPGGHIFGMVNLLITISTAEGGFVLILEDLIIRQDHRGRGFGSQLLAYALDFARRKDFLRVTLLTERMDEPAKRFFQAHGFHESSMVPMRRRLELEYPVAVG